MMRRLLPLLLVLLSIGPLWAKEIPPADVMGFLGSRELVGTILFAPGEEQIAIAAKAELDRIAGRLTAAGQPAKLIRIEGFSFRGEPIDLAMSRAKAVEVYLRETRKVTTEIYLMGYGSTTDAAARVEVALYDTLLPIGDAPVDSVIKKW
ncbi:MAG: OmpA family protein [Trichloromonadaceae bacterium]